MAKINQQN